ncbi:MAG TPA: DUF1015 family protein [Candidatus Nitrosopolaris sp.]|nr:DUF1015 family protein [Candidatus Nitrosopolaris sp.]
MQLHPFRALRPLPERAPRVAAPPYDVVSRTEAAGLGRGNPASFLHVTRAEIDLPDDVDPHDPRVHAQARANLDRFVAEGILVRESRPLLYVYRQATAERTRVGVTGCVHVDEYANDVIRRHETTRPDKEDDRTHHMLALGAHAEPVLLGYRGSVALDRLVTSQMAAAPIHDFTTADGVRHTVWPIAQVAPYVDAFRAVPVAYIADGHHRSASARRAAEVRRRAGQARPHGEREHDWFPAVLVPDSQLEILAYNRVITDLGGLTAGGVLARLATVGRLSRTDAGAPPRRGTFAVYVDRGWHLLELPEASLAERDPVRALDVSLLHEHVLGPILGIRDQRTDRRIDFVGGRCATRELEKRVDGGTASLAVALYPVTVEQLMAVSDAGFTMPPKSTWFEPKLVSGLFVHTLD